MTNQLFYAYARHAFVEALRLSHVSHGSKVLIPSFICRDILAAVSAIGAQPVFYDIGDDLQVPRQTVLPPAAALLAVNYFGFPADLLQLRSQLADRSTIVIEDNAHGWLSADSDGAALGSRSVVGFTSFRKTLRSLDGALLEWRNDPTIDCTNVSPAITPRTGLTPLSYQVRRFVSVLDRRSPLSLMAISRQLVRQSRRLRGSSAISDLPEDEFVLPATQAIHSTSLSMYERVNRATEVARRRHAYQACSDIAQQCHVESPIAGLGPNVSPQGFPFFTDTGDLAMFQRTITRCELGEIVSWPSLPTNSTLSATSRLRSIHLVNFLQ